MTQPERHLHSVPPVLSLPWWCRTFGHTFVRQLGRSEPGRIPTLMMCRRCGTRP